MKDRHYLYNDKVVFVSGLMGKNPFGTVYATPYGGTHRIKFRALPVRVTKEQAQADLDKFAAEKGWPEAK